MFMHLDFSRLARTGLYAGIAAVIVSMSGCGGGGGGSDAPAPATVSVSGVVIDGPIQGATVCLDLNNNGACDAGEPTSGATDVQGNYTISGLTSAQAGSPLIAIIPATAQDSGVAVGTAYTLRAPAGRGSVISPVTHLVQIGIAQGMTQAAAEAAVAAQLQVAATSLYNNYTTSTGGDNARLATLVPTVVSALQTNQPLLVETPTASAAGYTVRVFNFTNTGNYFLRYYYSSNVPDSAGLYTYYDVRKGLAGGVEQASSVLYDSYLVATPQGWLPFDGSTPNTSSAGSPYTSTYNRGYTYVGTRQDIDVSGMSFASVLAMVQDTVIGVDPALSGTMPAGAKVRRVVQTNTASPVAYRVSDGFIGGGVTTLAGMVAAFPVPAAGTVVTANNTASMAGLHGNAGCGQTFCPQERLRAAFGSGNTVTYYLCDIDTSTQVQSNCTVAGTGTYSLGTAADGTSPIMSFAGLPAATSVQTFTRVFVQRNGHVYYGWKEKLENFTQSRLNRVAFEALAAALGITPPTIAPAASAYAGNWSASYSGSDTGSCASVVINALGQLNGSCTSTGVGGSFTVAGSVTSAGVASFSASGGTSSGAAFTGSLTTSTGSGSWTQASTGFSGNWTATKLR